ncbi:hypothetical protein CDD80_150 [Ophiocordyceps camponoti-rufipedis]|uniref:Uncharacterized protein n=1 Tax=Ophiocordyceps camponoti-rufipedis TaxID=2004952 RepID=A0A2C5ZDN8_9HYPO|nr:hypothetical protein CDD80_150 [Ophiocordyceps camponoti-rufipedis]
MAFLTVASRIASASSIRSKADSFPSIPLVNPSGIDPHDSSPVDLAISQPTDDQHTKTQRIEPSNSSGPSLSSFPPISSLNPSPPIPSPTAGHEFRRNGPESQSRRHAKNPSFDTGDSDGASTSARN